MCYSSFFAKKLKKQLALSEGQKKRRALQEVQDAKQAALTLGPYDPADPMVLECQSQIRMLFGGFGKSR